MSEIIIERGALRRAGELTAKALGAGTAAIIADDTVNALYGDTLEKSLKDANWRVIRYAFTHGEASKNIAQYAEMLYFLSENELTRSDTVFALGGGVTGDMAGFAAATYLRGVKLVQLPTTLLACVDSSVGGKTAIDLPRGKNMAGAFYQPRMVICDPDTLATLPDEIFADGMAEVIKYAALCDAEMAGMFADPRGNIEKIIARCVAIKTKLVEKDEKDTGARQLLNFGHTFGHAIEKLSGYTLSHGKAVAAGMSIMARACARRGLCPQEDADRLISILISTGLPTSAICRPEEIYEAMRADKKRAGDAITLVTMNGFGRCELTKTDMQTAREFLLAGYDGEQHD